MKILIIGSNSFLGENLANFYKKNKNTIILNKRFSKKSKFDWSKSIIKNIIKNKPDTIFYCSSEQTSKDDPKNLKKILFTNCEVPCLIAHTLFKYKLIRSNFVVFGTSWETNFTGKYFPVNLYAASKKASENLLMHYTLNGVRVINFKLFDTYGPKDKRKKLLNLIIKSLKNNRKLKTTRGIQEINLTHVLDICRGIELGIKESLNWNFKKFGISNFYLGSKKTYTIRKIIKIVEKTLNKKKKLIFGELKYKEREPMKTFKDFKTPKKWKPINDIQVFLKILKC